MPIDSPIVEFLQLPDRCVSARRRFYPVRDRILETAFRSSVTVAPLDASIAVSTFLACSFESRSTLHRFVRCPAPPPPLVRPSRGRFRAEHPLSVRHRPLRRNLRRPLPFGTLQSLGLNVAAPVSSTGPPAGSARSPFAPHSRPLLKFRLQITVPGPLLFRRLAVQIGRAHV